MKKEIKDLTKEEKNKFCQKHKRCKDCPLVIKSKWNKKCDCVLFVIQREVEVDE